MSVSRYHPNIQTWEHHRYAKGANCPFRNKEEYASGVWQHIHTDKLGRVYFTSAKTCTENDRKKVGLLKSVVREDRVKSMTGRVTEPTTSTARKAYLSQFKLGEHQSVDRVRWLKQQQGRPTHSGLTSYLFNDYGDIRFSGRSGPRTGEPVTASTDNGCGGDVATKSNNPCAPLKRAGESLPAKTQDVYHRPLRQHRGWRSVQSDVTAHRYHESDTFRPRQSGNWSRYSIYKSKI